MAKLWCPGMAEMFTVFLDMHGYKHQCRRKGIGKKIKYYIGESKNNVMASQLKIVQVHGIEKLLQRIVCVPHQHDFLRPQAEGSDSGLSLRVTLSVYNKLLGLFATFFFLNSHLILVKQLCGSLFCFFICLFETSDFHK